MRNLENTKYLDIIDIFSQYKDIEPSELVKIIHLKTGLINMTYNDFQNIYNQLKNSNLYNNIIHCIKTTNFENINIKSYYNDHISNEKSKYITAYFNNHKNYTLNKITRYFLSLPAKSFLLRVCGFCPHLQAWQFKWNIHSSYPLYSSSTLLHSKQK